MAAARRDVFPAVLFLMPIAERFDGGKAEKSQVAGSGVIISPDGEAVTNQHVVDRAVEIRCLTSDGRARRASLVGADKDTDLALIRLERRDGETFPFARFGRSRDVEVGQFVMAMGAPWGLSRSVSMASSPASIGFSRGAEGITCGSRRMRRSIPAIPAGRWWTPPAG